MKRARHLLWNMLVDRATGLVVFLVQRADLEGSGVMRIRRSIVAGFVFLIFAGSAASVSGQTQPQTREGPSPSTIYYPPPPPDPGSGGGGGGDDCDKCFQGCTDSQNAKNKTCRYEPPGQPRQACFDEAQRLYQACKVDCCATEQSCNTHYTDCQT